MIVGRPTLFGDAGDLLKQTEGIADDDISDNLPASKVRR